jgi:hypothetical protein
MKTPCLVWLAYAACTLLVAGCTPLMAGTTVFSVAHAGLDDSCLGMPSVITFIQLRSAKCVIWSDALRHGPYNDPKYAPKTYRCAGVHTTFDGRRVEWECETKDGSTFTHVTIDAKSYRLSQGRIFLVSTRSGVTKIRQLKPDPVKLDLEGPARPSPNALWNLAERDPTIRAFFQGPQDKTAPLAHFRFNGNAKNEGKGQAQFELKNTEFKQFALLNGKYALIALYLNGKYEFSSDTDGYRAICSTPAFEYKAFTVGIKLRAEEF